VYFFVLKRGGFAQSGVKGDSTSFATLLLSRNRFIVKDMTSGGDYGGTRDNPRLSFVIWWEQDTIP
jgi:hypothetical protein